MARTGRSTTISSPTTAADVDVLNTTPVGTEYGLVVRTLGTVTTTPPANASTNVTQFGSNAVATGTGASGVGVPRVTVSNDSNVIVTPPTLTKGTQGATGFSVQDLKDAGRTWLSFTLDRVAGVASEALATMAINKLGVTSSATTYTVTAGKTLRLQSMTFTAIANSTVAPFGRVRVRALNGTVLATSPIVITLDAGNNLASATCVAGNSSDPASITIPDGFEFAAGWQIGITQLMNATTTSVSVTLLGYEY